ncbi:hypothetical protein WL94_28190 [Burkholderia cepacia]|nr:hypothetical protein WL94_28190 [Burkholderia cepacia]
MYSKSSLLLASLDEQFDIGSFSRQGPYEFSIIIANGISFLFLTNMLRKCFEVCSKRRSRDAENALK